MSDWRYLIDAAAPCAPAPSPWCPNNPTVAYLPLSGGTMQGPLILVHDPVQPLEAATKEYVDAILNSPNFTGTPTAPTPALTTSNNQLATTSFVHALVASGGTFIDAPADGTTYGRLNNNWSRVLSLSGGTLTGPLIWTSTGTTAPRAAQDRTAESMNVLDFGADATGAADSSPAFQAAFNAVAGGGRVIVPEGTYSLHSSITATLTAGVTLEGAGAISTHLNCSGGNGLAITLSGGAATFSAKGLTFARIASAGAAFASTGLSVTASATWQAGIFSDLFFFGSTGYAWATGLALTAPVTAALRDITVIGPNANNTGAGVGISITGIPGSSIYAIDNNLDNISVQGCSTGLQLGSWVQGIYITNSRFVGNDYGINWQTGAGFPEWLSASNTHFNSGTAGILAHGVGWFGVENCLFLRFSTGATVWAAMDLEGCNNITLNNNNVYGLGTGSETGIIVNNTSTQPSTVSANAIARIAGYAVVLSGTTAETTVSGNSSNGIQNAVFCNDTSGPGTNNLIFGNICNSVADFGTINIPANVRAYGAKGDGSTDDTAAFNAAIASHRPLYVPGGTYIIQPLTITQGMSGDGMGVSVLRAASGTPTTAAMITQNAASGATVRDLTLDGRNLALYGINLPIANPRQAGLRFVRLEITNISSSAATPSPLPSGIWCDVTPATPTNKQAIVVTECYVHDCFGDGIYVNGTGCVISDNTIVNTASAGISCGLMVDGVISGNTCYNVGTQPNITADGISGYGHTNTRVLIIGNTVDTGADNGIHFGGSNIQIVGNKVRNITGAHGIQLACEADPGNPGNPYPGQNAIVANNEIDTVAMSGVFCNIFTRTIVLGNTCSNITQHALYAYQCSDSVINDNIVWTAGGYGVYSNASLNLQVRNNRINGTGNRAVYDAGGSTGMQVSDNIVTSEAITSNFDRVLQPLGSGGIVANGALTVNGTATTSGNLTVNGSNLIAAGGEVDIGTGATRAWQLFGGAASYLIGVNPNAGANIVMRTPGGNIVLQNQNQGYIAQLMDGTANAATVANSLQFWNAVSGSPSVIQTVGSDTNRSIQIIPAGTGTVQLQGAASTSGNLAVNGGALNLSGTPANFLLYNTAGVGAPTFTTRSVGTKIVIYPQVTSTSVDTAIGLAGNNFWHSVPTNATSNIFSWYGGTTQVAYLDGVGNFYAVTNVWCPGGFTVTASGTYPFQLLVVPGSPATQQLQFQGPNYAISCNGSTGNISFLVGSSIATVSPSGLNVTTGAYQVGGTKVVGAQITGYGTPTGNSRTANFNGSTATAAQTAAQLAQLIVDLKTHGLLGA